MGPAKLGREEARVAKVTKPRPGLAYFDCFMSSFHKQKKKYSLASFFFFNYLLGIFMVDTLGRFAAFYDD